MGLILSSPRWVTNGQDDHEEPRSLHLSVQKHKTLIYFKRKIITLMIWSGYFSARSSILVPPFAQAIITCWFIIHHPLPSDSVHSSTAIHAQSVHVIPTYHLSSSLEEIAIQIYKTCKTLPIPVKKDEALTGPALARSKAIAKYISLIRASFWHKKTCTQHSFDKLCQNFALLMWMFPKTTKSAPDPVMIFFSLPI